jgi:hypothetical protein
MQATGLATSKLRFAGVIVVVILVVVTGCAPSLETPSTTPASASAVDPLPSWNDGPAKQAILDFVARVIDPTNLDFVPERERIAVFDNDGPVLVRLPEIDFVDDKAGKPVGIDRHIGRRPIAAFGNSDGDLQMLQWTTAGDGARLDDHKTAMRLCDRIARRLPGRRAARPFPPTRTRGPEDSWKISCSLRFRLTISGFDPPTPVSESASDGAFGKVTASSRRVPFGAFC